MVPGAPNLLQDKNWFLIRRRRSFQAPTSRTRQKKPTTANRSSLQAAMEEVMKYMPNVCRSSYRSEENLAKFPHGEGVEIKEEESVRQTFVGKCTWNGSFLRPGLMRERTTVEEL